MDALIPNKLRYMVEFPTERTYLDATFDSIDDAKRAVIREYAASKYRGEKPSNKFIIVTERGFPCVEDTVTRMLKAAKAA